LKRLLKADVKAWFDFFFSTGSSLSSMARARSRSRSFSSSESVPGSMPFHRSLPISWVGIAGAAGGAALEGLLSTRENDTAVKKINIYQ
jgi:hypothetical protein